MVLPDATFQPQAQELIAHLPLPIPDLVQRICRDQGGIDHDLTFTLKQEVVTDAKG
ncbi:Glycosyl transferase (plasmid) [Pseudomonas putida]|jgi:hypothetical protein|uniref:Glycosyl transferase n=1 Tax=Pseudomonas putida TaxID=303 RepID=A0A1L7NPB8_PSEPU|nr:Glycosyl transferase [Pseudomonas putida]